RDELRRGRAVHGRASAARAAERRRGGAPLYAHAATAFELRAGPRGDPRATRQSARCRLGDAALSRPPTRRGLAAAEAARDRSRPLRKRRRPPFRAAFLGSWVRA